MMLTRISGTVAVVMAMGGCTEPLEAPTDARVWADELELCEETVESIEVGINGQTGDPNVRVSLTKRGARKFLRVTSKAVGKELKFEFDGKVLASPVVHDPVGGGSFEIVSSNDQLLKRASATMRLSCLGKRQAKK